VARFGIAPFLATLGTLFVGRSAQQLLTGGGNPIYLPPSGIPGAFAYLGHGKLIGVPFSLWIVAVLAAIAGFVLTKTRFGRGVTAVGVQHGVAFHSGLRVERITALIYIIASTIAAAAGLVVTATVGVYAPYAGNGFLLNAIGATFIGTTLGRRGRPSVIGTLLGVFLLAVVGNGLLLVGLNYYWQQVGTGALIFIVLATSFFREKT